MGYIIGILLGVILAFAVYSVWKSSNMMDEEITRLQILNERMECFIRRGNEEMKKIEEQRKKRGGDNGMDKN